MPEAGRIRADLKPRVENSDWCVRLSVGWLSRTATRRPDKSSRLVTFSNRCRPLHPSGGKRTLQEPLAPAPCEYPLPLGHSVEKRTFVRPLSRVPLLAPFPSRPSTPWLHALQSSMCFNHTWRVRHLESYPVSFEALGGLAVPPPAVVKQVPTPQPHKFVL